MMCYERCCRLCLKDLIGPGIDCSTILEMRDAISILFDVKILRTDSSRCICNKCFESVMAFKAFKKTVSECQKIIQDYETIKKKILESRTLSIKQEIIDLSDSESAGPASKSKRKRPIGNSVTDSQINDILDMVHDSTTNKNSIKVNSPNASKKLKTTATTSTASSVPITIKKEPNTSNTPPPTVPSDSRVTRGQTSTPTSSKDVTNKVTTNNDKRSDSICSTSTSGIGSSLDTSKIVVKKEPGTTGFEVSQPKDITNIEPVTSSVQTPTEEHQGNDSATSLSNNTSTPIAKKKIANTKSPTRASSVGVNNNTIIEKGQTSAAATNQSLLDKSEKQTAHNGAIPKLRCNLCSSVFNLEKDYDNHLKKHKNVKEELDKSQALKNKQINKIKEENSISSSEEEMKAPVTRGRSSRQAKTQALKKLGSPPKRRYSSSPAGVKKPARAAVGLKSLNNTVGPSTMKDSSPFAHKKPEEPSKSDNPPKPVQGVGQQKPTTPKDKKRVITITLLKTKDSVNFKYCDQYKNIIEFDTITPEELQDIRISLMIPEIWNNLTNVFKTSPPDDRTIEQLKNIFGEKFRF